MEIDYSRADRAIELADTLLEDAAAGQYGLARLRLERTHCEEMHDLVIALLSLVQARSHYDDVGWEIDSSSGKEGVSDD